MSWSRSLRHYLGRPSTFYPPTDKSFQVPSLGETEPQDLMRISLTRFLSHIWKALDAGDYLPGNIARFVDSPGWMAWVAFG